MKPSVDQLESRLALLRQAWPNERMILLLEATLADLPRARAAWAEWNEITTLDAASWPEVRVAAALATRIGTLEPGSSSAGRIQGFRRYFFAHTHRMLNVAGSMLKALREGGVDVMLLKGSVRLARRPNAVAERYLSDVDALIRPEHWDRAWAVVQKHGWEWRDYDNPLAGDSLASRSAFQHALELIPTGADRAGRLDLHLHARYVSRNIGDEDRLWADSVPAQFLGVDVRLPSPTDHLLLTLSHALLHARDGGAADWALDIAEALASGPVDWERLVRDARAAHLQGFVAAPLLLAREKLNLPIPEPVITELAAHFDETLRGEFRYLTQSYYRSIKHAKFLPQAREAAILRAKTAVRRQPPQPPRQKPLHLAPITLPKTAAGPTILVIPLPPDLRASDRLDLSLRFSFAGPAGKGTVALFSPQLPLAVFRAKKAVDGKVRANLELSAPLLAMTRSSLLGLKLYADTEISDLNVSWQRPTALQTARRWAGRLKRRVLARLRAGRPQASGSSPR